MKTNKYVLNLVDTYYLRGRILKGNILSNKVPPFHNDGATTKGSSPYHPSILQRKQQNSHHSWLTPTNQQNKFEFWHKPTSPKVENMEKIITWF